MAPEGEVARREYGRTGETAHVSGPADAVPGVPAADGSLALEPAGDRAMESEGTVIVGIGASAGGQDALERFLNRLPPETGMAFVVVQHLAPTFDSMLVDLLARHTSMPVLQVREGMEAAPNHVYVIPPNRNLGVLNGAFHVMERDPSDGLRLPIDYFFRSLAQDRKTRAVGIILSGAGADGSVGLKAIKENGGAVLAQDPKSAAFDSMPRSAIATGMVDFVLPPEGMPECLLAYVRHPYVRPATELPDSAGPEWLAKILVLLRSDTGHDFSLHKPKTLSRCIERRMALHKIKRTDDYYRYLQTTPKEIATLFKELLIGVTAFFRDPDAFASLREKVICPLLHGRPRGDPIRVWVPGCASGEEAYSIAILLAEQMEESKQDVKVQIFATDLDRETIERARTGCYPANVVAGVNPERLQRFFTRVKDGYQVNQRLRGMVLFAVQSVIKDPPFSRLDLISCRNVMIYLDHALQKQILAVFHHVLKPGGFLFLGTSETAEAHSRLFKTLDARQRLFEKTGNVYPRTALPRLAAPWIGGRVASHQSLPGPNAGLRETIEKMLLDQSPTCVAVDRGGEVLLIRGRTGAYLEVPPGEGVPSNLFRVARQGLKMPLAYVVQRAAETKERVVYERAQVRSGGGVQNVRLVANPILEPPYEPEIVLVQFHEVEAEPALEAAAGENQGEHVKDARMAEMEIELQAMREHLQSSVEELEAANEEFESVNEELQSANEELETSREELQSVNEELLTLSAEREAKIEQLTRTKSDLENTLTQVDVGIIFLDRDLNIRHFNAAATRISNLIDSDVGRPLGHIVSKIKYSSMMTDAKAVFERLEPKEVEVEAEDGRWYVMRILPYRTTERLVDGVTLTFSDVTEQKRAEKILRSHAALMDLAAERLARVVRDSYNAITVQDLEGRILAWNPAAERIYGWSEAEALQMNVCDLLPDEKHGEARDLARKLAGGEVVEPFKTRRTTKQGKSVEIWLTVSSLVDAEGKQYAVVTTERELATGNNPSTGGPHDGAKTR